MNKILNILCCLLSIYTCTVSASECYEEYKIVGDFLKINNFLKVGFDSVIESGNVVSSDCTASSFDKKYIIAAFAYIPTKVMKNDEETRIIFIGLIDKIKRKIVSSYSNLIYLDAVTDFDENSLKIDNETYKIAKNASAIGVRYQSSAHGPSCAQGSYSDELTLFMVKKSYLVPVFKRYMSQSQTDGCIGAARTNEDNSIVESAELTLSVEKKSSHGIKNLLVTS